MVQSIISSLNTASSLASAPDPVSRAYGTDLKTVRLVRNISITVFILFAERAKRISYCWRLNCGKTKSDAARNRKL